MSLGSNNGSIELHLLREGVDEIVAYEADDEYAAQGRFLTAACECVDNREYRLRYVVGDMRQAAWAEGRFDFVVALCSLYYLPEEDMHGIGVAIANKSSKFILQCNVRMDIGREDPDQYRRASVEFATDLLREVGFSSIAVIAPRNYSRPLVEGVRP